MWTIACKYFGTHPDGTLKAKLLKCGQAYPLARKDAKININEPFISRSHGTFTVGPYTENDVYNMEAIPTLEYGGGKPFRIARGEEMIPVVAGGVHVVYHAEAVLVSNKMNDAPIIAWWTDIVCLVDDISTISAKDCTEMGIKVTLEYHPKITHLVTDQITGEPNQLPVLLHGGAIVNKQWTRELVRRLHLPANLPDSETASLEDNCLQPPIEDHLPTISPNLKRGYHQKALWAPRQERKGMFKGRHFLFLIEGPTLANVWKNVVTAGDGTYETFDIHQGLSKWSTNLAIARGKTAEKDTTLVLIAEEGNLDAAVGEQWKNFIRETERIGLRFLPYERITEAILILNKDLLTSVFNPGQPTSQRAEQVPTSFPDEPSVVEPSLPAARRVRRAPSATPAAESVRSASEVPVSQDEEGLPSRSKLIRRRVREPSAEPVGDPQTSQSTLNRALLRRRDPTQASQMSYTPREESVLDRHRQLFEETDPERQMSPSQAQGTSNPGLSLAEMVEEAERQRVEAVEKALSPTRKRKAHESIEEEPEDDEPEVRGTSKPRSRAGPRSGSAAPPAKKRALQRVAPVDLGAVEEEEEPAPSGTAKPSKKSTKASNKGPTQVDKDENFLVALASMKKGKKKEEQTDRDFNSLKIAKPVAEDPDIDMLAWELLPKDMDIRGNFMVCVDNVEVRQNTQSIRRRDGNPAWVGRPDFKKFLKKVPAKRTGVVELVANLSIDDAFEDEVIEIEPDQDFDVPQVNAKGKGKGKITRTQVVAVSDNEGSQEVDGFSGRAAITARSRTQKQQPLFLPDSDEEKSSRFKSVDQSDQEDAPKGKGKAATTKRKAVVLAASSSEDDAYDKRRKKRK
ncbi:hypothetical protein M408DRAFT_328052 [Serendipita vermifera MAFF 305830]|uniref:Uncharacterized protein n=1 Tax=Serendipita vermifera MAFF 305830 TaxID=933852 RepID=A0A0C2WWF3_SERVB|nr:hypothetical protein M408DRAFT_328052 [Serendipita vermifera MAFF 305830]